MFTQQKLVKVENQSRGIFNKYIYKTEDTLAEVIAPGYFEASRYAETEPEEWENGLIQVKCSDGFGMGFLDSNGDLVLSLEEGGGGSSFSISSRDGSVGAQTTSLITSTYVEFNLPDMALPSAASESGVTHLGNGRFEVDSDGDYDIVINGVLTSTQSASVGSNITYGIWNGASYVPVTADEVAYTLQSKNAAADSGSPYIQEVFGAISLSAGDRIALMCEKTSGTYHARARGLTIAIYKRP